MKLRWIVASLAVALMALTAETAAAQTKHVTAGPSSRPKLAQLDYDAYFRSAVTVHTGDTVSWTINGFHTVTFVPKGSAAPPFILPAPGDPIKSVVDAAGRAFFFNGAPNLHINPAVAFPAGGATFDGTSYTNSGLPVGPLAGKPYALKFTKTGVFHYLCIVHPGMVGTVKVVAPGTAIPSSSADAKAARAEAAADLAQGRVLARVKPAANKVLAGHDKGAVALLRFFPQTIKVKVGQTVEFDQASRPEIHTITIGPAAYDTALENGFTQVKPAPAGPPAIALNPLAAFPSDPLPLPPFDGTNHGNGFLNAGIISLGGGGLPSKVKIRFTKKGTFHFECVIHKGMDGTIKVT